MNLKPDQKRVKDLLVDTIASLCRDGLSYIENLSIHGVIGITVDRSEVFLVHINQEISSGDVNNGVEYKKTPQNYNKASSARFNNNRSISVNNTSTSLSRNASQNHVKSEPRSPKNQTNRYNSNNYEPLLNYYSLGFDTQNNSEQKMIKVA